MNDDDDNGDDGRPSYKLTFCAFGSGELKRRNEVAATI